MIKIKNSFQLHWLLSI